MAKEMVVFALSLAADLRASATPSQAHTATKARRPSSLRPSRVMVHEMVAVVSPLQSLCDSLVSASSNESTATREALAQKKLPAAATADGMQLSPLIPSKVEEYVAAVPSEFSDHNFTELLSCLRNSASTPLRTSSRKWSVPAARRGEKQQCDYCPCAPQKLRCTLLMCNWS